MKTPRISEESVRAIGDANGVDQSKPYIVAIRGYYLDSMGKKGRNDRRIYDDAIILVTPRGIMTYQANTDPNGYRAGYGTGRKKGMATLRKGIHIYGTGKHKRRLAFRQCEKVTVIRDGLNGNNYTDLGYHAINIHSGGHTSTSSLGCQTIPKSTWEEFRRLVYGALDEFKAPYQKNDWGHKVRSFPYVLIEETDRRKGDLKVSDRYFK